jgi:hypothetical protein
VADKIIQNEKHQNPEIFPEILVQDGGALLKEHSLALFRNQVSSVVRRFFCRSTRGQSNPSASTRPGSRPR